MSLETVECRTVQDQQCTRPTMLNVMSFDAKRGQKDNIG